ncbi:Dos2-interacting transcription regulator of RNA-Pol-II-domain-containing protein [Cunninghamella echinulata]|nr:Dos2-interacting transcription regulator of RNA-Pol-II-domain-containing protein [Cunninghamella echinulata]
MEEENKSTLEKWLASSESQVPPSLLASVLLDVTKSINGFSDLLYLFDQQWNSIHTTSQVKCIDLLAQAITPSLSSISSNNVKDIIQFIKTKMENSSIVPRYMDILLQLIDHDLCELDQCINICNMLFQNIPNKKWSQSTRYKVLTILGHILQKNVKDINRSSLNFIEGFISVMDGEKDPRNLLVSFDLIKYMIDKLDISRNVEDLFDILFCYFPISFTPPPNDPLAITSDELKLRLRCCLASSPYFAYFATPLLTEKLNTCSGSAKKDTMDTIRMCAPTYGAHVLLLHAKELFEGLVKEVYEGNDLVMESVALETIHQIVATLATGISIVNIRDPVEKAIEALLHQAVENLKQPELKHAKSASMILRAAASASDPACTLVVNAVIPLIYQEYNINDSISRQKSILGILIDILEASNSLYGSIDSTGKDRDLQTPLTIYKQQILQIFVNSLIQEDPLDKQLRYQSLLGIRLMVIMKRFLSIEEVDITVAQLTRFTLDDDKDVRNLVLSTLAIVSKQTPDALIRHTLPYFMKKLESRSNDYYDILSSIKILTISPVLFCAIIQPLIVELDTICKLPGDSFVEYSYALADCLHHILSTIEITSDILTIGQTLLLPTIINESVKSTIKAPHCWKMTSPLLNRLGLIAAIIVRSSSSNVQSTIILNAFKLFIDGDIKTINLTTTTTNISYQLFGSCMPQSNVNEDDGNECERDMTIFFPAIVGNCRRDVSQ